MVSRSKAMSALPTWAHWSIFAAAALLSPVLPFLMAGVFTNVVAVLKAAGPPAFLALVAAGIAAWSMLYKLVGSGAPPRTHVSAPKNGAACRLVKTPGSRPLGKTIRVRSFPGSRSWAHVRLVDFGQPAGRYTDPQQRVHPGPSEEDSQRTSTLETP
jgi:hypothetical protein